MTNQTKKAPSWASTTRVQPERRPNISSTSGTRFAIVSFGLSPDGHEGIADGVRREQAAMRVTRMRLRGYRAALEEADLPWSEVPVYECPGSAKEMIPGRRDVIPFEQEPTAISP